MENKENNEASTWLIVIGVIALMIMIWFMFYKSPEPLQSPVVVPVTNTTDTTTDTKETVIKETEVVVTVTPEATTSPSVTPTVSE